MNAFNISWGLKMANVMEESMKMEKYSLTMAWWGVCSAMFYLVVAAALAVGFGTRNAIIGMTLSVLCYGLINGVIARYAIRTGLSVAEFSKIILGRTGATLATLIFASTAVYYGIFEGSVMAVALHSYAPSISMEWAILIVVLYSTVLVLGKSLRWLDKLNGVLLPLYLLGLCVLVGVAVNEYGYSSDWLRMEPSDGASPLGWWNCFTYFMGVWVLMMYTWDYARFGKAEDSRFLSLFSFGIPFYLVAFLLNGLVGIFLAATIASGSEITEVSVVLAIVQLMGFWGLLFVWITQTRINTGNFYMAITNLHAFFARYGAGRVPHAVWAAAVGIIVYMAMHFDVFSYILRALTYQAIFIVGWVGIAMAHIFTPYYERKFNAVQHVNSSELPDFNKVGVSVWLISVVLGVILNLSDNLFLSAWSAPCAFLVAFSGYALLMRKMSVSWFVK